MSTTPECLNSIRITDYTDYVPFIADLVRHKRETGRFSYRLFCRKSGFKSPIYLKWVIDRVRRISLRSTHKFVAGLALKDEEAHYFLLMVNYREAHDPQTKRHYYEEMLERKKRRAGGDTKDAYEYLSHWYYVALRELIASPEFQEDPRWIRDRLGGDLTIGEIRAGLETLERLKLIRRDPKGRWRQSGRDLHTDHEVKSLAAFNYHAEMLDRAQKAMTQFPSEEREYRSLVALIDDEKFRVVKERIEKFQNDLVDYLEKQEQINGSPRAPQELYALNVQLLPLTARRRRRDL